MTVQDIKHFQKKDSEYHGYGIESMRRIVKKYDGKLDVT